MRFTATKKEIRSTAAQPLEAARAELTAVFVMNDLAAIGAIRALKDMGYDCPKDVSVVGCDDIELSKLHIPSISTFGFDKARYGTKMAEKTIVSASKID